LVKVVVLTILTGIHMTVTLANVITKILEECEDVIEII